MGGGGALARDCTGAACCAGVHTQCGVPPQSSRRGLTRVVRPQQRPAPARGSAPRAFCQTWRGVSWEMHQQQLARRRGRACGVAGAVTDDPNGRAGVRGQCWVHAAGHNAVRSSAVSCCVSCAASCSEQCVRSGERAVVGGGDDGAARSSRRGGTWSGARLSSSRFPEKPSARQSSLGQR